MYVPPNNALQRTPLARPLTWARFRNAVACQRSCRFMDVASSATDALRWAAVHVRTTLVSHLGLTLVTTRAKIKEYTVETLVLSTAQVY